MVLAISGGVDSAVAAVLLRDEGYDVHALFMRNWEEDEDGYCTAAADLQDARRVCEELDIPLHVVNFAAEYRERVFAHFLAELRAGRTPNPDVACNREIKFGACFEHARRLGAARFATGHYARATVVDGNAQLLRAADRSKDQSYFLHTVPGGLLAHTIFPIGHLPKAEVRRLAHERALPVHDKRDSTGICFIGERPFAEFLSHYLPAHPGRIETTAGRVLGEHRGLMYYTLGQRQGLGIGGTRGGSDLPWFVAGKDRARNALVVVQGHDHPSLYQREVHARDMHWIAGTTPTLPARRGAKTRYRMPDAACTVAAMAGGVRATFDVPQWAPTPGQYLVLYDGELCLGGGVIVAAPAGVEAAAGEAATAG